MKDKSVKEILVTALSLFAICAAAAGVLGFVNQITAPAIEEIQAREADEARAAVLPAAASFEEGQTPEGEAYYIGRTADGAVAGYVFTTSAASYGGRLELMTGIDADGTVTGITPLVIDDTPGLGMKAKDETVQARWVGKSTQLHVIKDGTPAEDEVVAITSATVTSKAVTGCVNRALELWASVDKEA